MLPGKPMLEVWRWIAAAFFFGLLSCSAGSAELPRQAELSVSGLTLNDPASAATPLGTPPYLDDAESDQPKVCICNADKSEKLTLVYYEGDTANIISEFRVERVETRYVDCLQPPTGIGRFSTGKGISLGMTQPEVARILGNQFTQHEQLDETVISYRIDNGKESDFLLRQSSPAYFGQYHFKENRLARFSFGLEYP
jgi:hypothetical protein